MSRPIRRITCARCERPNMLHSTRGLCRGCSKNQAKQGLLEDWPMVRHNRGYARLAEYEHLRDLGFTTEDCLRQLGVSAEGFERQMQRLQVPVPVGLVEVSGRERRERQTRARRKTADTQSS